MNDSERQQKLVAQSQRGDRAKQILNDPLVVEAFSQMEDAVIENLRTSHWSHQDEREELYKMLRVIDDFKGKFRQHVEGGKKAKTLLQRLFKGE